uniref:(northern house mosquito) hypothetical protein n=1 Tax=Culex pipiens TaxID=7175 RepID=A0A8D8G8C4_CULPI
MILHNVRLKLPCSCPHSSSPVRPNHHRVEDLWPQDRDTPDHRHHDDQRLAGPERIGRFRRLRGPTPVHRRGCHGRRTFFLSTTTGGNFQFSPQPTQQRLLAGFFSFLQLLRAIFAALTFLFVSLFAHFVSCFSADYYIT